MVVETKKINEINIAEYNPRKALKKGDKEYEKIRKSIEEFGLVEPLVWNKRTGRLVGGHQRIKVLSDLGVESVPVAVVDLDDISEKKLNIALNRVQGEWDFGMLAEIIREFEINNVNYDSTGWDESDIRAILHSFEDKSSDDKTEYDDIPKIVKEGDIWQLGEHVLFCSDCGQEDVYDYIKNNIGMVNTIITSPPYAKKRANKYFVPGVDAYAMWLTELSKNFYKILSADGSFFLNVKEPTEDGQRSLCVFETVILMVKFGWKYIEEYVWVKKGLTGGWKTRLRNDYEPVYWFAKDDPAVIARIYEEGVIEGDAYVDEFGRVLHIAKTVKVKFYPKANGNVSDRFTRIKIKTENETTGNVAASGLAINKGIVAPGNVVFAKKNVESWGHPAMFNTELVEFFTNMTTDKGDIIMDPFGGSGTTMIAAENIGRKSVLIEMKPEYCDIVIERFRRKFKDKEIKKIGELWAKKLADPKN